MVIVTKINHFQNNTQTKPKSGKTVQNQVVSSSSTQQKKKRKK